MIYNHNNFSEKSYEYAVGAIGASRFKVLSNEQLAKIEKSDYRLSVSMLGEFGYSNKAETINDKIEQYLNEMVHFLKSIVPNPELFGCLLFEEDSYNMKLCLKSKLMETDNSNKLSERGYFPAQLIKLCAEMDDFSSLGKTIENKLKNIKKETDGFVISSVCDIAFLENALKTAQHEKCKEMQKYLQIIADEKNKLSLFRAKKIGISEDKCKKYLLQSENNGIYNINKYKCTEEIKSETEHNLKQFFDEFADKLSIIEFIKLYHSKIKETHTLRTLFLDKIKPF